MKSLLFALSVLGVTHMEARVNRVLVLRHGERLDHIRPEWALGATRAHDSPLSALGKEQARAAGRHYREHMKRGKTVFVSSPLVRVVQTAASFFDGAFDAPDTEPLLIDSCLAENETAVRNRMLGLHKKSVAKKALCTPVLLGAGDLVAHHPSIDTTYDPVHDIQYDSDGYELNPDKQRCTMIERAERCLPLLIEKWGPAKEQEGEGEEDEDEDDGVTLVLFTHGGVTKTVVKELTHAPEPLNSVSYCEIFELVPIGSSEDDEKRIWKVANTWRPESSVGGHDGRDSSKAD